MANITVKESIAKIYKRMNRQTKRKHKLPSEAAIERILMRKYSPVAENLVNKLISQPGKMDNAVDKYFNRTTSAMRIIEQSLDELRRNPNDTTRNELIMLIRGQKKELISSVALALALEKAAPEKYKELLNRFHFNEEYVGRMKRLLFATLEP